MGKQEQQINRFQKLKNQHNEQKIQHGVLQDKVKNFQTELEEKMKEAKDIGIKGKSSKELLENIQKRIESLTKKIEEKLENAETIIQENKESSE